MNLSISDGNKYDNLKLSYPGTEEKVLHAYFILRDFLGDIQDLLNTTDKKIDPALKGQILEIVYRIYDDLGVNHGVR